MVASVPADPNQEPQLWRADQPIRFHHLLGSEQRRGGGSLHEPGKSSLGFGGHQHPHRRLVLFQRFSLEELPRTILPPPLTVIDPMQTKPFTPVVGSGRTTFKQNFSRRWLYPRAGTVIQCWALFLPLVQTEMLL